LEELRDLQNAATAIGQQLVVVSATSDRDFEVAFASIAQQRADVLLISQDRSFSKPVTSLSRWRRAIAFPRFTRPARASLKVA
jgi:ABC-type uncharacterized transport system substrate-binding protein